MFASAWCSGEDGELVFNGYRDSIWDGLNVLEMDCDDDCRTMRMHLMLLNCTLKNG